jgi:hypothetical protein
VEEYQLLEFGFIYRSNEVNTPIVALIRSSSPPQFTNSRGQILPGNFSSSTPKFGEVALQGGSEVNWRAGNPTFKHIEVLQSLILYR